jgi:hypothetical protein
MHTCKKNSVAICLIKSGKMPGLKRLQGIVLSWPQGYPEAYKNVTHTLGALHFVLLINTPIPLLRLQDLSMPTVQYMQFPSNKRVAA